MSPTFEANHLRDDSSGSSVIDEVDWDGFDHDTNELEAIAVIGFALKFPDDATSPEGFWKMIAEKRCASKEFPKERLNIEAFHHPENVRRNTVPLRGGHFIREDLGVFDTNFFSITPSEAVGMDPAQRILLETSYHAFENAGISLQKASGSATSVHTGCFTRDHEVTLLRDAEDLPKNAATGSSLSLLANRLSWFYNLTGPSVNLDSACSSSAMALDDACNLLRGRDCDMSLVAGANMCFAIDYTAFLSKMGFLSPDSRCHTFDRRANGYARGEGVGVVLLKRVSDAIRDGDMIRAVVRSSKANQDSRTPGITQPSLRAQERLIRETYRKAGLSMKYTRYMEAHGTGTKLGDATETSAIGNAFRLSRRPDDPLYIGSVKTNIGHLEGAAGIAGLIKAIMIVETGVILPDTNFEKLNPKIDIEFLRMKLPHECLPWPTEGLRRASINSFGFGGSNCHVVIDDAYHYLKARGIVARHRTAPAPPRLLEGETNLLQLQLFNDRQNDEGLDMAERTPKLLTLSSADEKGIDRLAEQYQKHISKLLETSELDQDTYLCNLIYTLDSCRSPLPFKAHMPVTTLTDLLDLPNQISSPVMARSEVPRPAFVFTGQGAQYYDMGRSLFAFSVFRDSIQAADDYLTLLNGSKWSATEELHRSENDSRINRADYSQALCTVLQVALVDLLESIGIKPYATVGHSSGEIAAAYCAGLISRESAWKIAFSRGQVAVTLAEKASVKGAMMAVGLSAEDSEPYIARINAENVHFPVSVSCINSQKSTTISGPDAALDKLKALLDAEKIFARKLKVPVGYHSKQMEEVADEYLRSLGKISGRHDSCTTLPMISSVVERRVTAEDVQSPSYWVSNLTSPVRFLGAVKKLCSSNRKVLTKKLDSSHEQAVFVDVLVEVGPHAALQGPIRDILNSTSRSSEIDYFSILRRNNDSSQTFLSLVGNLHEIGVKVKFRKLNDPDSQLRRQRVQLTDLPQYSFDHSTSYWHESRINKQYRLRKHGYVELLGTPSLDWNPLDAQWRNVINLAELPWAEEHKINGATLCPGAGMMVMAIEAVMQLADSSKLVTAYNLRQVTFRNALDLAGGNMETRLSLRRSHSTLHDQDPWYEFALYSYKNENWTGHCSGSIQLQYEDHTIEDPSGCLRLCKETWNERSRICHHEADSKDFYRFLNDRGTMYGPNFQAIDNLKCSNVDEIVADLALYQEERKVSSMNVIHPATLDAFMHSIFAAQSKGGKEQIRTQVPTSVESLWISNTNLLDCHEGNLRISTKLTGLTPRSTKCSAFALNNTQTNVQILIEGLEMSAVSDFPKAAEMKPGEDMVWNHMNQTIDLDMLTNEEISNWVQHASGDFDGKIKAYLKAAAFKNPDMKLLQVGAENRDWTRLSLESMSIEEENSILATMFNRYDITDSNSSEVEKSRNEFSEYAQKMSFSTHITSPDIQSGFQDESYDMILMKDQDLHRNLIHARRLLKSKAKLLLQSSNSAENLHDLLETNGFTGVEISFNNSSDQQNIFIASTSNKTPESFQPSLPVVIVYDSASEMQTETASVLHDSILSKHLSEVKKISTSDAYGSNLQENCIHILLMDLDKPMLPALTETTLPPFQNFMKQGKHARMLWVSGGGGAGKADPGFGVTEGFCRALRLEMNDLRLVQLSLESFQQSPQQMAKQVGKVMKTLSIAQDSYEREYTEIGGHLHINRLIPANHLHAENLGRIYGTKRSVQKLKDVPRFSVDFNTPGKLDSIEFTSIDQPPELKEGEIEIEIKSIGLNTSDLETATGMRSVVELGNECSGIISRVGPCTSRNFRPGDRVCAVGIGMFNSHTIITSTNSIAHIPEEISFDQAAILPQDLLLGAHLSDIARIRSGDTVLVYSGADRLSLCIAKAAQHLGALVNVVAKSGDDYSLFKDRLSLPDNQILQSTALSSQMRYGNHPQGVDTAFLLSSDDASLENIMSCVSPTGQLIHVSSAHSNGCVPKARPGVSYRSIDDEALGASFAAPRQSLQVLVDQELQHLPATPEILSFKVSQSEQALRSSKDRNPLRRNVLRIEPDDAVLINSDGRSNYSLDANASYVVSGGFGGLGRAIVRWMASKGARNIIVLSRSGPQSAEARELVEELTSSGVRIHAPPCDTSKLSILQETMEDCQKCMPPIKGCIQSAGTIRDVWFDSMDYTEWSALMIPKVVGSWNLHLALPDEMDFFLFTASISGILGQITQTNYSSANTYQDALAAYIRHHKPGQRAMSLDLGLLESEGLLKDRPDLVARLRSTGSFLQISYPEINAIFDMYCDPSRPVYANAPNIQPIIGIESPSRVLAAGRDLIDSMQQPLWSVMRGVSDGSTDNTDNQGETIKTTKPVIEMMADAESALEAANIAADALSKRIATILGVSPEKFDPQKPGRTYGLDSLAAVDVRNWISKTFAVDVPVFDILGDSSPYELGHGIARKVANEKKESGK